MYTTRETSLVVALLLVVSGLIQGRIIYQTEPNRVVVRPGERISFLGKTGLPITSCQFFHAPSWNIIDLSLGRRSISTDEYEYHGAGLEKGECGMTMKKIVIGNDGIIQSRIKTSDDSEWELSASTLRVTEISKSRLPVFEMVPKRASLRPGDNLTFSCNTDREIEMCHIYLPGGQFLNFNRGVNSDETKRYRYFGTGLKDGQCGATLLNVDDRINGIIVCKLGDFPEATSGVWETDSLNAVTKEAVYQTEPQRVLVRPGESVSLLGRSWTPIASCQFFHAPSWSIIDLSLGPKSKSTNVYEYFGSGLENGECGITMKNIIEANDGIIQSRVKVNADSEWELAASTLRVTGQSIYQTTPTRTVVRAGGQVSFVGKAGAPITACEFLYAPTWQYIDLSQGINSNPTSDYEYYGTGLDKGECGITIKNVIDRNDGTIQSRIKRSANSEWEMSSSTLRVTDLKASRLPVFNMNPKRATLQPGDNLTFTCNVDHEIEMCHIYLPGGQFLNFDRGVQSEGTKNHKYLGTGLKNGDCGGTFTNVDDKLNGIVVCKLGDFPETVNGAWETDSLNVVTKVQPKSLLPVFEMKPKRAILNLGDNLTFTCNTDRAIEMCHIYLPGGQFLDFNRGADSDSTKRYRYHGTGLKNGQCGATLLNVDERINGIIVCKLGNFPEANNGVWETDSLNVVTRSGTSNPVRATTSRPPVTTARPAKLECGQVQVQPIPLLTNAQGTERGQWPWHVAMYSSKENGLKYICGASLIAPKIVVTAAHCVTERPLGRAVNPDSLVLYFGKYHLLQWSELGTQTKQIKRIRVNPGYNATSYAGDFAILILQSAVSYTQFVRPICLWSPDRTSVDTIVEQLGYVVGWGFDETGVPTNELMMAKLPVVSHIKCIRSDPSFFSLFTSEKTYCAGLKNGTSVCRGDSGGGMYFPMKQADNSVAWFLRGVVSISKSVDKGGERTCDTSDYAVFTDLAKYLDIVTPYIR